MKTIFQATLCAALAVGVLGSAAPDSSGPARPQQESAKQEAQKGPSPLQEAMRVLNSSQRKLRKQIKDLKANQRDLLSTLSIMEGAAYSAIALVPTAADRIPKGDQAVWVIEYKRKMTSLLDTILVMQAATHRADAEGLTAAYESMKEVKGAGHKAFRDL